MEVGIAQSVYSLRYELDNRGIGVRLPAMAIDFPFPHSVQTDSVAPLTPYPMSIAALSPGVKQPGRETSHSPLSSAKVKNKSI
jgi:hypothetical protein